MDLDVLSNTVVKVQYRVEENNLARIALPRLLRVPAPAKAKFTSVGIILVVVSTLTQSVDLALKCLILKKPPLKPTMM